MADPKKKRPPMSWEVEGAGLGVPSKGDTSFPFLPREINVGGQFIPRQQLIDWQDTRSSQQEAFEYQRKQLKPIGTGIEAAFAPITITGMATKDILTTPEALLTGKGKQDLESRTQAIMKEFNYPYGTAKELATGEISKKEYEALPEWRQMLWEAPAWAALAATPGAAQTSAAAKASASPFVRGLGLALEGTGIPAVERAIPEAIAVVFRPVTSKLGGLGQATYEKLLAGKIDRWIAVQGRLDPKYKGQFYKTFNSLFVKNEPRMVENATKRFNTRMATAKGKANGVAWAAKKSAEDTFKDLKPLLIQAGKESRAVTTAAAPKAPTVPTTGKAYTATVFRGTHKVENLGKQVEFGNAPHGYYTTDENVARAYATSFPNRSLKGDPVKLQADLEASMKAVGGKVTSGQVTLKNPYVMPEGGNAYINKIVSKAQKEAERKGLDMAAQAEAAAKAIPKQLQASGYDGLIVKRDEGYYEVIPYKTRPSDIVKPSTLTHFGKPGLSTISPSFAGTGQAGSEARFMEEYKPYFEKEGFFVKRSYYYGEGQKVEPRFVGKTKYQVAPEIKLYDPNKATSAEVKKFVEAKDELTAKFKKEFGEQFGNLPQQAVEINLAAAKQAGFKGFQGKDAVVVFEDVSVALKQKPITSGSELKKVIQNEQWAILTAAKGKDVSRMGQLQSDIEKLGYNPNKTTGVYKGEPSEPGFLVRDMPKEEALALGTKYDQESVLVPEGLLYQDNTIEPFDVTKTDFGASVTDDHTAIVVGKDTKRFSIPPKQGVEAPSKPIESIVDPAELDKQAIASLTKKIKEAHPLKKIESKLRTTEMGKRVAQVEKILQKGVKEGKGVEIAREATAPLKGQLPDVAFAPLEMAPEEVAALVRIITQSRELTLTRRRAIESLGDILAGKMPQIAEIGHLEDIFGKEFAKAILDKRSGGKKALELFSDIINIPKTVMSIVDWSNTLRQSAIPTVAHPTISVPALGRTARSSVPTWVSKITRTMSGEDYAVALEQGERLDRFANRRAQAGLFDPSLTRVSTPATERVEGFISQSLKKIPVLGGVVRWSERNFIVYGNAMRRGLFNWQAAKWEQQGFKATAKEDKILAEFLNNTTGRGSIKGLESVMPLANFAFFSPRFQFSRIGTFKSLYSGSPTVRKLAARDITIATLTGMTVLALYALGGAEVELDPRATDWGKGKIGNTRLDYWGGYLPYARLAAGLITGQKKYPSGRIYNVSRTRLLTNFARTKFSPALGTIADTEAGYAFTGERMPPRQEEALEYFFNHGIPFFINDMREAMNEEGIGKGAWLGSVGFLGVGVQSYDDADSIVSEVYTARNNGFAAQEKIQELAKFGKNEAKVQKMVADNPELVFQQDPKTGEWYSETFRTLNRTTIKLSELRTIREDVKDHPDMKPEEKQQLVASINGLMISISTSLFTVMDELEMRTWTNKSVDVKHFKQGLGFY